MKREIICLRFATVTRYKNQYFITFLGLNAIFVYDLKDKKLSYLDSFQTDDNPYYMYMWSFIYEDELWFLPRNTEQIAILNLSDMKLRYINLDLCDEHSISDPMYINYVCFNEHFVCFVPRGVHKAVIINMKTKKVENYYKISKGKEEFQNAVLIDNTLVFYPWHGNQKVSLDLLSKEMTYEEWDGNEKYGDAIYDKASGKIFHAPAQDNHLLIEDVYGNILERKAVDIHFKRTIYYTYYASFHDDEILFWGSQGVISVNPQTNDICYFQIRKETDGKFLSPITSPAKEAFVYGGDKIFQYDDIKEEYTPIKINIAFQELINQIEKAGKNFCDIYRYIEHDIEIENDPLTLNNFIHLLKADVPISCIKDTASKNYDLIKEHDLFKLLLQ